MRTLALVVSFTLAPLVAEAAQFPGYSDTGWSWSDKSECCAEAIALAQEDGMNRCQVSGGFPNMRFMRRGNCRWRSNVDGYGSRVYRCWGDTKISCK